MAKLTLNDISNITGNPTSAEQLVNANFTKLEEAVENSISRDGTAPNFMSASLDMNSNRILNLPYAVHDTEPVTLLQAATIAGVSSPLTRESVGAVLWPQTAEETAASVVVLDYYFEPGDIRRYYDGSGDYTVALQAAVDSSAVVKLVPNTSHTISNTVNCYASGSRIIEGQNATISLDSAIPALLFAPLIKNTTTLLNDAQINNYSITVTSVEDMLVGDLLRMYSSEQWYYNPNSGAPDYIPENMRKGELHRIQKITGTTVTLDSPLFDNYDVSAETVTIEIMSPINVVLRDFSIIYPENSVTVGASVYYGTGSIENVRVQNAARQGLYLRCCYGLTARVDVRGSNEAGFGYGIQASECYDVWAMHSSFSRCRRGVDFSGYIPSRNCGGVDCYVDGTGLTTTGGTLLSDNSGFGSHESSEYITWKNCTATYVKNAFVLRGANLVVDGCEGIGKISQSFVVSNRAANIRVTNCRYSPNLRPLKTLNVVAVDDDENTSPWFAYIANPEAWSATQGVYYHFADNEAQGLKNGFINFAMTSDSDATDPLGGTLITEMSGLTLLNNKVVLSGSTATTTAFILDSSNNAFTLKNSYISNNIFRKEGDIVTLAFVRTTAGRAITLDSTVVIDQVTRGATLAVTDGSSITHGHLKTPLGVLVTTSVANEWAAVDNITSTNFRVRLTKHDNTAGSSQTIYWQVFG